MTEKLLAVRDLYVNFYTYEGVVKALDGVNFDIYAGEIFGLVGETGCGKSVTSLAILNLIRPPGLIVKGQVMFKGNDLLKKSQEEMRKIRGNQISMIFQDPRTYLNPVYTIGEQMTDIAMLHQNVSKRDAIKKCIESLALVGLPDPERVMRSYVHQLSGGMCQRAMIAMKLLCKPELLIADEPTTAVDVTIQAQVLELLRELKRKLLGSTLLITHDLGVVAELCDRVGVMYAGNIVELADVKELFANPLHPYTQGLMRAIPMINRPTERLETIPGSVPDLIHAPSGCRFHPRCLPASEKCKVEKPNLIEMGTGHTVACHR